MLDRCHALAVAAMNAVGGLTADERGLLAHASPALLAAIEHALAALADPEPPAAGRRLAVAPRLAARRRALVPLDCGVAVGRGLGVAELWLAEDRRTAGVQAGPSGTGKELQAKSRSIDWSCVALVQL